MPTTPRMAFGWHLRAFRRIAITVGSAVYALCQPLPAQQNPKTQVPFSSKRMADGKEWMTGNLNIRTPDSYCYDDQESNCSKYGRLYAWKSARRACALVGPAWRLPEDDEWRRLAKAYGGVSQDSENKGKLAYKALLTGGDSGFNAVLGGGRSENGEYARGDAHGFYWTATEIDAGGAWFYNFGAGGQALHRQDGGEKGRAFSVRCVKD